MDAPTCPQCQTEGPFLVCDNGAHFTIGCTVCHNVFRVGKPEVCPACEGTGVKKDE